MFQETRYKSGGKSELGGHTGMHKEDPLGESGSALRKSTGKVGNEIQNSTKRQSLILSDVQAVRGPESCLPRASCKVSTKRHLSSENNYQSSTKKSCRHPKNGGGETLTRINSNISESATHDRFVPRNDSAMDTLSSQVNLRDTTDREQLKILDPDRVAYQEKVAQACGVNLGKRILAFNPEAPNYSKFELKSTWLKPDKPYSRSLAQRKIKMEPEKILDAPCLSDDYYLSLLDWSSRNIVAIGLGEKVYIWNANTGVASKLSQCAEGSYISSLQWSEDGAYLSVGISEGKIEIWSINEIRKLRTMYGHESRVGALSWNRNILSSGGKDGTIWNHDVRVVEHKISSFVLHESDVCGLRWRSDGLVLASGGNDNQVAVWDSRSSVPVMVKSDHMAAVKALAWCPWLRNTLASGGGSFDRKMNFWNVSTGTKISTINTGSQITSILWSQPHKEIFTAHGYPKNHLSLWKYPSLKRIGDLPGHDTRVLHAALSPDGQVVATAASDENLKFWLIWETPDAKKQPGKKEGDLLRYNSGGGVSLSGRRLAIR